MWAANLALLASTLAWMLWDPEFPLAARGFVHTINFYRNDSWMSLFYTGSPDVGRRLDYLLSLVIGSLLTLTGIFTTLFAGSHRHRNLRSWFAFTLLVAAWLTLFVAWREFAWQGQRLRLWTQLDDFEPVAAELQKNWPRGDGKLPKVGAFMAYPQGKPRTLLVLAQSEAQPGTSFSAVEREDDGSLKFELAGDETGSWLEWHPAGSTPDNFTGGLENTYTRGRSAPLGNGWYLVRYR